jgi:hypothetical protein
MAELGDSLTVRARGPLLHAVLELVDVVVERVHEGEVALGDLIEQVVHAHPR